MTFNHFRDIEKDLPDLNTVNIGGKQHYVTPDGNTHPSVTTVLSILSKEGIEQWKKRVGYDVATSEARRAAARGNAYHSIVTDYLQNKPVEIHNDKVLPMALFERTKEKIDCIDNIYAQEKTLFSNDLGIAGRVDCIAEFENTLSVIDFKTSNRKKKQEWIKGYYLQETAYSLMWQGQTGISASQIVTIIACEDGSVQVFVEHRDNFVSELKRCIEEFKIQIKNQTADKKGMILH